MMTAKKYILHTYTGQTDLWLDSLVTVTNDKVLLNGGNDRAFIYSGNDIIHGGRGDDEFYLVPPALDIGDNLAGMTVKLYGDSGDDEFFRISLDLHKGFINGGSGQDTVHLLLDDDDFQVKHRGDLVTIRDEDSVLYLRGVEHIQFDY